MAYSMHSPKYKPLLKRMNQLTEGETDTNSLYCVKNTVNVSNFRHTIKTNIALNRFTEEHVTFFSHVDTHI